MANDGRFTEGNAARRIHGGEAALKEIQASRPLTGLAAAAESEVMTELETSGAPAIVRRNATRLQAAADLFWNAIAKAAQDGDMKTLDRYIARFGWLSGAALRAWAQVVQGDKSDGKQNIIDAALKDIQGANDE